MFNDPKYVLCRGGHFCVEIFTNFTTSSCVLIFSSALAFLTKSSAHTSA
jgi:hypothetical protein